jgi:hypothetical protein
MERLLLIATAGALLALLLPAQQPVAKVWDEQALAGWHVPLADRGHEPDPLTAEQFYRLPELKIYKSYSVYAPGREPAGYMEKLRRAAPELAFNASRIRSDADWLRAGQLVFEAPVAISSLDAAGYISDSAWNRDHHVPVAKDGTVPFYRYVVREKGRLNSEHFPARIATRGYYPMDPCLMERKVITRALKATRI